jgi:hypothetical protein
MTAESTNFKISNAAGDPKISEREKKLRSATNLTPLYLNQLLSYIEAKVEDPIIRDMVVKKAKSYPHSALDKFFANFDKIVSECQHKLHEIRMLELGVKSKATPNKKEKITTDDLLDMQKAFEEDEDIIS